ncbi:hypothetical protein [Microbulbifer sp. TYP-18]|uniref:hypothetical protein n=1 Tax=Microbulbifer sp. TYP-18 TaxID=3230024 RepID=UPI0034C68A22
MTCDSNIPVGGKNPLFFLPQPINNFCVYPVNIRIVNIAIYGSVEKYVLSIGGDAGKEIRFVGVDLTAHIDGGAPGTILLPETINPARL